jgi:hypothetical protein
VRRSILPILVQVPNLSVDELLTLVPFTSIGVKVPDVILDTVLNPVTLNVPPVLFLNVAVPAV